MKYKIHLPIVFLAPLLIFSAVSCNDSIGDKPTPKRVSNVVAHITYTNKAGANLLNPSTSGSYDHKEIRVYYLKDDHKKLAIDSTGYPPSKGWGVDTVSTIQRGPYFLSVVMPGPALVGLPKNAKTTTLIKLKNGIVDTLRAHFKITPSLYIVDKVWYNGELKWSQSKDTTGNIHFTIRK